MKSFDSFEQDEDLDDEKTIAFIRNYLPQELKDRFDDDTLTYFLDVIYEYYDDSGILDSEPDAEGFVNIDLEKVAAYMASEAKKDGIGEFEAEDLLFVVQGEMEYGSQLGQVE